jgi:beta propeller repeat protein
MVEAPIPFTLGVLVKNVGYGMARAVSIQSEQPRIVENEQGLILVAQLLGARIDDEPTDYTSLNLEFGNVQPGKCRKGAWDMITSLSGEFQEFKASYTHASELGGRDTSIIKDLDAYFIIHEVRNDQPGRDNLLDFLADTVDDDEQMPDTLYESDCNTLPVNVLSDVELLEYNNYVATLRANADFENWVYFRLDDPAQAAYAIESVVRSDGKVLDENNYWTHIRYHPKTNAKLTYLNIFDFVTLGQYDYVVTYLPVQDDTDPPETMIRFAGEAHESAGVYYILPETQVYFVAEDVNTVSIFYRLDGDPPEFQPAYPFTIDEAGAHTVEYYSKDSFNNEEDVKIANLVVSSDYPAIENVAADTDELFVTGDAVSVRPNRTSIQFDGITTAAPLTGSVDVYRGVYGFVTLDGVPSSPTPLNDATIHVGGTHVDYYRYKINSGSWSSETESATPISLSGLETGPIQLSVRGRSTLGDYLPDDQAVTVYWFVDPAAPGIGVTGPETPNRSTEADLSVSGADYYCYRVDGQGYRPDPGSGTPVQLTGLSEGEHVVEVVSRGGSGEACPGDVSGTAYGWLIDRSYGFDLPEEARVYQTSLGEISGTVEFAWDGRDDSGAVVTPGWYTVRVSVTDALGRTSYAVQWVQVGDMLADGRLLSDTGNAPQKEAHAVGSWAVWQDQRNGNWDIFAQDLTDPLATPVAMTTNPYNQERPRTDGTYVVWEDRQADGTWDIWAKNLLSDDPVFAVTETPDTDERKPVVYWPWVVYQAKPVSDPYAPWQLVAHNMLAGTTEPVDPTGQDQVDPAVHRQKVVWQDFRDAGPGEVYYRDLKTDDVQRITDDPGAQLWPVIFDPWIVWSDSRNGQLDLYGYNLARNAEIRLTSTPYNETRPHVNGKWAVFTEDSAGGLNTNIQILYLSNLATIQLTNMESEKEKPAMASGQLLWTDSRNGMKQVMIGTVPDLQPVFNNRNAVAVTAGMAALQQDAYTLLRTWNEHAGVTAITHYTAFLPQPVPETALWENGQPGGDNFTLEPGHFVWVKFDGSKIIDLGLSECGDLILAEGANVFSHACFPDHYTAYALIRDLGLSSVRAVRMLDSDTGFWKVASVVDGNIVGEDFNIPAIAVIMLDMEESVGPWRPGESP